MAKKKKAIKKQVIKLKEPITVQEPIKQAEPEVFDEPTIKVKESFFKSPEVIKNAGWFCAIILAVALIIVAVDNGTHPQIPPSPQTPINNINTISVDDAQALAQSYITKYLLRPGTNFSINNIEDNHDVYMINITVNKNVFYAFLTKDGKYLFPTAFDVNYPPPKAQ